MLCDELDVALAFVAELEGDSHERLHVFAYCRTVDTEWDAVEEVPGPPLTDVLDEDVVENAQRLRDRYPGDAFFDDLGVESAFAVPLTSSDGRYIGHLGVMDVVPRGPTPEQVDVLAIIGARVALEDRAPSLGARAAQGGGGAGGAAPGRDARRAGRAARAAARRGDVREACRLFGEPDGEPRPGSRTTATSA